MIPFNPKFEDQIGNKHMQKPFLRDGTLPDMLLPDLFKPFGMNSTGSNFLNTCSSVFRDVANRFGPRYGQGCNNRFHYMNMDLIDKLGFCSSKVEKDTPKMQSNLKPDVTDFLATIKLKTFGSPTLKHFEFGDLNVVMKDILPEVITDTLWPLNVNSGNMNFYDSFSLGYLACRYAGTVFQRAVAHRALTRPQEFTNICDIFNEEPRVVLESIRHGKSPSHTEIALLSQIVDRNITVFHFDDNGQIKSDTFYDLNNHGVSNAPSNYLGCVSEGDVKTFFPLVRKNGITKPPPEAKTSAFVSISNATKQQQQHSHCAWTNDTDITILSEPLVKRGLDFNTREQNIGGWISSENTSRIISGVPDNKSGPEATTTIPEAKTANSETRKAIQVSRTAISERRIAIPEPRNEVPQAEAIIAACLAPKTATAQSGTASPETKTANTETRFAIPETRISFPDSRTATPKTRACISDTKTIIPETRTGFAAKLPRNKGLPNIGNTCYFNSLMQAFLSVPILQTKDLPLPFKQMHELIFRHENIQISVPVATLNAFHNLNVTLKNKLKLGQQEDCHDFFSSFLGLEASKPLHPYLEIVSKQTVNCLTKSCTYKSTRDQDTLQMSIEPNISIQDCVTASAHVNEERDFRCETGCCQITKCVFKSYVTKFPPVLMIFTTLFDSFTNVKVTYNKDYKPFEDFVNLPIASSNCSVRYKLSSFITHSGTERFQGHYKAYVRRESSWLCCNDNVVTVIPQPILNKNEHVYVQFLLRSD